MGTKTSTDSHARRRVQDALKHLHEAEYAGAVATTASLAGATGLPLEQACDLVDELTRAGLAASSATGLELTDAGREQARQVVRAHRVYETYLAHHTGVESGEWHQRADQAEHHLSPEDVDALADSLGRPRYDPHGDPIPTREGALPPRRGIPLLNMQDGSDAVIVHLEDEPSGVYRQAAKLGLASGARLHILRRTPGHLHIRTENRQFELPLAIAAAIQAEPCAPAPPMRALSSLKSGEAAPIVALSPSIVGRERRRLLDLGLVAGTRIERDFDSMLGSPTAYRVRGAMIALRKEQADRIFVEA